MGRVKGGGVREAAWKGGDWGWIDVLINTSTVVGIRNSKIIYSFEVKTQPRASKSFPFLILNLNEKAKCVMNMIINKSKHCY